MVRRVPYGEADAIVTLFTERLGKVSALARGARRASRRGTAIIEAMHTLSVSVGERPSAELYVLHDAALQRPRLHLTADLARMDAAGHALRWVRAGSPARTPDPRVWTEITGLLDRLDDSGDVGSPALQLAATGLRLLAAFGYGLELGSCVRCSKPCEPDRLSYIDAARGGLVCRACGGARHLLEPACRARLAAAAGGKDGALLQEDVRIAQLLVDEALAAHAGVVG